MGRLKILHFILSKQCAATMKYRTINIIIILVDIDISKFFSAKNYGFLQLITTPKTHQTFNYQ
jgi:hypothetical protein